MARAERRAQRLARYDQLRAERPHLFVNPPGAAYEIVFDRESQDRVADGSAAWLAGAGKPVEYGDIGVVYEDAYVVAVRDAVRFRDGRLGPYIRVVGAEAGTGAAVLPQLADDRFVLIRHFRHGLRTWQWEIPRGFAEPGGDGAATAARELEEEIGIAPDKLELLGSMASEDGTAEIYLARLDSDAPPADAPPGAVDEGIDGQRIVSRSELHEMIAAGEVQDAYLLAAVAFASAKGLI